MSPHNGDATIDEVVVERDDEHATMTAVRAAPIVHSLSFNMPSHCFHALLARDLLSTPEDTGGRQPGQFYGVHNIVTDSKGNLYTTETYEGKRLQKFVFKGLQPIHAARK